MNTINYSKNIIKHLKDLKFVNSALNSLPTEENKGVRSRGVSGYNYSRVTPTPLENPRIISLSEPAFALLDVDAEAVKSDPESAEYLAGNKILPGSEPIAHCYCGYQFGSFAGQLGDGRAISLGDVRNSKGELWDLQLKGSGHTPYSRSADGRAVLRSSIREFLCSEAMAALGVATTRAASLIISDTLAQRDPLYNGNVIDEKCAIVMRLSPTFMRFGSFEIFIESQGRAGPSLGKEKQMLPKMLDYVLENFYPEVAKMKESQNLSKEDCYFEMYKEITRRSVKTVALWQCYGFCHGVLNTDNMSILGVTIDYGPFGWMDNFDKNHICNHSDKSGRYSYANQPQIFKWNLLKLAEAWKSAVPIDKMTTFIKDYFDKTFDEFYYEKMREKIGLVYSKEAEDKKLIDELFNVMDECSCDFTNTFRKLSDFSLSPNSEEHNLEVAKEIISYSVEYNDYVNKYKPSMSSDQIAKIKMVMNVNPTYLLMMGFDPEILDVEEAKLEKFNQIKETTEEQLKEKINKLWKDWLEMYKKRLQKEKDFVLKKNDDKMDEETKGDAELDQSKTVQEFDKTRKARMDKVNPKFILRNYLAEEAIKLAEGGDYSKVETLLQLLLNPFEDKENIKKTKDYSKCRPRWAQNICVSCSS